MVEVTWVFLHCMHCLAIVALEGRVKINALCVLWHVVFTKMELSWEKGASTWLTALPIDDHGFALHKSAFRDALSLWYDWSLQNSRSHCSCSQPLSVERALTCKTGGFPAVRHKVRYIAASLLSEVCHGVTTEPHLQTAVTLRWDYVTSIRNSSFVCNRSSEKTARLNSRETGYISI